MNKINKGLLIWNIIITLVVLGAVFSACSSNATVDFLVQQNQDLSVRVQTLESKLTNLENQFQTQMQNLQNQMTTTDNSLLQMINSMGQ
jgi:outer membrane murein-binding lipoprotein Lpp